MSFEHLDSSHNVLEASRSSIFSRNANELEEKKMLKFELKQSLYMHNGNCGWQPREIDHSTLKEACNIEESKEPPEASHSMLEKKKEKWKDALEKAPIVQKIAEFESKKRSHEVEE